MVAFNRPGSDSMRTNINKGVAATETESKPYFSRRSKRSGILDFSRPGRFFQISWCFSQKNPVETGFCDRSQSTRH